MNDGWKLPFDIVKNPWWHIKIFYSNPEGVRLTFEEITNHFLTAYDIQKFVRDRPNAFPNIEKIETIIAASKSDFGFDGHEGMARITVYNSETDVKVRWMHSSMTQAE